MDNGVIGSAIHWILVVIRPPLETIRKQYIPKNMKALREVTLAHEVTRYKNTTMVLPWICHPPLPWLDLSWPFGPLLDLLIVQQVKNVCKQHLMFHLWMDLIVCKPNRALPDLCLLRCRWIKVKSATAFFYIPLSLSLLLNFILYIDLIVLGLNLSNHSSTVGEYFVPLPFPLTMCCAIRAFVMALEVEPSLDWLKGNREQTSKRNHLSVLYALMTADIHPHKQAEL